MSFGNSQKVTLMPHGIELASGTINNLGITGQSGTNTAVGAAYEIVQNLGGTRNELYKFPLNESTGQQLKIVSTSTDDTNSGSGATRQVRIRGLGPAGVEQVAQYNMNGTTVVTTTDYWTAVNQIQSHKVGSAGDTNAGDIKLYANDGSTELLRMEAGTGTGAGAFLYVAKDQTNYLTQLYCNAINEAEVTMFVRRHTEGSNRGFQTKYTVVLKDSGIVYDVLNSFQLREGDCIEIRAKRLDSTDAKVNADISLVKNS